MSKTTSSKPRTKQLVSAGEVCSIDIAKKYGFYDNNHYYTQDYTDIKTYSDIDTTEGRDSNAICKQTKDGKIAYPSCTLVYGMPYEQDPTDRSKCIVNIKNFCPSKMVKGNVCRRSNILFPAPVSMQTHCDEKATDWYMIPNYHLGNKYNFIQQKGQKEAQCMKPCPADKIPGDIDVNKCYNKKEYKGGYYNESENFCPIAWVYRLGQKEEEIADDIIQKINESGSSNVYNKIAISVANKEAKQIYKDSKRLLENIDYPDENTMDACYKLNTPERVKKAYSICKDIFDNPDSIDKISDPVQKQVLINSCHVLFCNEEDDLVSSLGSSKDALCFKDFKPIDSKDLLLNDKMIDKEMNTDATIDQPPQKIELNILNNGPNLIKLSFYLVIFAMFFIFLYMIWDWIYPLLVRIWNFVKGVLKGLLDQTK